MSNYYWSEFFFGRPPAERYPNWVEGADMWREFIGGDAFARQRLLDVLVSRRASVSWGAAGTELSRPRLFVSHRKDDEARARDVATLAQAEGFQVWLDVLDSGLQNTAQASAGTPADALAVALIIEMALLNCTHVIALLTPITPGTYWVPYEYGRVKDSSPHSLRAACWIDQDVSYKPEYLELGVKTRSDDEIRGWLRGEIAEWNREFASSASGAEFARERPAAIAGGTRSDRQAVPRGPGHRHSSAGPARPSARKAPDGIPSDDDGPMLLVTERDIIVKGIRLKRREAQ